MIRPPLPADAIEPNVVIHDLIVGRGALAQEGDDVIVHYVARLLSGKEFDSSRERRQPLRFALGMGEAIQGMHDGLKGMRVGGLRKLTIPADLAYGQRGLGESVPPNATLVYEVELLRVS
ncbi:MAG TPA: FKBP-type peptidyl-prolyl cis-trans isomerase [Burkholderiales bacterium]|nr:FKBP-type peptidyl-prolyl cis-trans isomerase [Burkholderiales bacterium]